VTVNDATPEHPLPPMARKGNDARRFVIIGAGAAGWRAAETLRREGFEGSITVFSDEPHGPLDRVELSKSYLGADDNPETPLVRSDADRAGIDITLRHATVQGIDTATHEVVLFHSGERVPFDRLLVATGCDARPLDLPGVALPGIHHLRTLADADALRRDLAECPREGPCRVAIVGGGFIGLEVATALSARSDIEVTVVLNESLPLAGIFGSEFATRLRDEHQAAGVQFVPDAGVTGFTGGGRVAGLILGSGQRIEADLVLVAVGARPRTAFLPFPAEQDGGIAVADDLSVPDHPDIYLAGDIAHLPTPWGRVRIEHWRFAQETGELAARNMLGGNESYGGTPFFWTKQQPGGSYSYTGHAQEWDSIKGAPDGNSFALNYVNAHKVAAILALGFDDAVVLAGRRMGGTGPLPQSQDKPFE